MNMYPYLDAMKEILERDADAKKQFIKVLYRKSPK